ncbi:MAG: hypothetical protein KAI64_06710, partial [Thermoplasmata archaeon]|nr:hypothetical protein [Thermoplasmata archaeon]
SKSAVVSSITSDLKEMGFDVANLRLGGWQTHWDYNASFYVWKLEEATRDRDAREYKEVERERNKQKRKADALKRRGGEGSGHEGHRGRPGEVGGSLPSTGKIEEGREEAAERKKGVVFDEGVQETEITEEELPDWIDVYPITGEGGESLSAGYTPSNPRFQFNENLDMVGQIPSEDVAAFLDSLPEDTRTMTADQRWDLLKVLLDMPAEKLFGLGDKLDAMPQLRALEQDPSVSIPELNVGRRIEGMRDVVNAATTYLSYMQSAGKYFEKDRGDLSEGIINNAEAGLGYDLYGVHHWKDEDIRSYYYQETEEKSLVGRGGEGSGHHEHEGREGKVGGSLPSGQGGGLDKGAKGKIRKNLSDPLRGGKTLDKVSDEEARATIDSLKKFDLEELREMQDEAKAGIESGANMEHFQMLDRLLGEAVLEKEFGDEDLEKTGEDEAPDVTGVMIKVGDDALHFDSQEQYDSIKGFAQEMNKEAVAVEPELSATMSNLASENGGDMSGLEFAVKSEESILRKIRGKMIEDDLDEADAAARINDKNRYTMLFNPESYVENVKAVQTELEKRGWTMYDTKWKNYWAGGDDYDGYNTIMLNEETGERFELQYHTYESIAIKAKSHEIYAQLRVTPESEMTVRDRLYTEMQGLWSAEYVRPLNFEQLEGVVK